MELSPTVNGAVDKGPEGADQPRLLEPRSYLRADMGAAELHGFVRGRAAAFSGKAPGSAGPNEDAAALIPFDAASGVLVVADGAGGTPAGEEASRLAIETLVEGVRAAAEAGGGLREAILDAIERANQRIQALGTGSATTLAAVELQGATVRSYHVGDSMTLVTGQRGRIKQQTVAHSPMGYAVESGLLDEAEAVNHEERHVVSNLLGTSDMRIEIGPTLTLAPRDTVVVASDGLSDNLYVAEIVDAVRAGPLARVAEGLVAACRRRMEGGVEGEPSHPDDLTFLLFRLE